jgi:hypothetical protein
MSFSVGARSVKRDARGYRIRIDRRRARDRRVSMDEEKMKRAMETVDCLSRSMRDGWKTAADQQRHQDSMVVWIVGLASAAVVSLPPMYNYVQDMKSAPRWVLGIPIGFFVLTVILGIVVRLRLERLIQEDGILATMKIVGWETLRFKHSEGEEGRKDVLRDAQAILDDRDPGISTQKQKLAKISRSLDRLERLPFVFFALGVLSAALFAICPPNKCAAVPW